MAPVDWSHVPVATNAAERLAFAQLYETLIDIDCDGHARPALAASWTLDPTKTRVTLSLRHDPMFWSGRPLTADDVLAAWRRSAAQSTSSARLAREIAGGTTVIDDHTLVVSLPDTAWMVLASPTLSIYEQQAAARWPEGSGPYRIAEQSAPGGFRLMPIASQSAPYLVSAPVPSHDPRDAIDAGSDVLVTDDKMAVAYAAARPNLEAVTLPWRRTYALALSGAAPMIASALLRPDSESAALRISLAHDAVRAEARAAQPPYWWDGSPACGTILDSLPAARVANGRSNRVVYRREDAIARGLAERLVAFDVHSVAAGLSPDAFARALRDGGELAYVLDLTRVSLSPCDDLRELRSSAPWLIAGPSADARVLALIDTRESAIMSRNRVSATVDWSGTLHFAQREPRP
ncbi:MAG TPA: ABC transporter substrate-binding protein [Gemmatimonadaceae bacterium]